MPRQARTKSSSDIYHIMARGINKEQIFKTRTHKSAVIDIIKEIMPDIDFDIIAYCIMDNHLHLMIKVDCDKLDILMKRMNIKYAMHYNKVEKRYGHVFQDRFKSEAVEDDKYLLGALRYIHNNPVKAGIVNSILDYKWSSANDYFYSKNGIVAEKYLKEILHMFKDKNEFLTFHNKDDQNVYVDTKEEENEKIRGITNSLIEEFIIENKLNDRSNFNLNEKEKLSEKLLKANVISLREVAELCSLSYYRVIEVKNKMTS